MAFREFLVMIFICFNIFWFLMEPYVPITTMEYLVFVKFQGFNLLRSIRTNLGSLELWNKAQKKWSKTSSNPTAQRKAYRPMQIPFSSLKHIGWDHSSRQQTRLKQARQRQPSHLGDHIQSGVHGKIFFFLENNNNISQINIVRRAAYGFVLKVEA